MVADGQNGGSRGGLCSRVGEEGGGEGGARLGSGWLAGSLARLARWLAAQSGGDGGLGTAGEALCGPSRSVPSERARCASWAVGGRACVCVCAAGPQPARASTLGVHLITWPLSVLARQAGRAGAQLA